MHQRNAGRALLRLCTGAVAEMGMGVVNRRSPVSGPARVCDAGAGDQLVLVDLLLQFGHPSRAAGAVQTGLCASGCAIDRGATVHRNAAGVIAPVFESLQTLDQHRDDIARRDCADDSTHI